MSTKKPKDLHMGEVAYDAFYTRPQVHFDDLNFDAQMKWVTLARAVVDEWKRSVVVPKREAAQEEQREKWREQKRRANGGGANVSKKARKGFIIKSLEEKEKDWDEGDEADKKYLTENERKHWTTNEQNARARMAYRDGQRKKLGLEPKHHGMLLR